jgi:hypothetical protein
MSADILLPEVFAAKNKDHTGDLHLKPPVQE